jgi:hypothetical protein
MSLPENDKVDAGLVSPEEDVVRVGSSSSAHGKASLDDTAGAPVSSWRWAVLAVFALTEFSHALPGFLFAPIATTFERLWGIDNNAINVIPLIVLVVPIIMTWPAMAYADRRSSIEASFAIGVVVNALCSWVRFAVPSEGAAGYWTAVVTQVFMSGTGPFLIVLPAKLSALYFPASERVLATGLATIASMFGAGVGMFMSPFFVANVRGLFLVQALLATVPLPLGALVFDRRKLSEFWTPAPRGEGAAEPVSVCAFFLASVKRVAKSGPMLHLLLMIALAVGTVQTILNLLNIACQPSFCSPSSTSVLALSLFGSALLGGSAVSLVADRLPWDYVEVLRAVGLLAMAAVSLAMAGWYTDSYWLVVGGFIATGCFSFGLVPLTIELGVEYLYSPSAPNVEASVVGLITIAYNLGTSLLLYISTPGNVMSSRNLAVFWEALFALTLLLILLLPKRFNRRDHKAQAATRAALSEPCAAV